MEVIASGLNGAAIGEVKNLGSSMRVSEAGHHFIMPDLATANLAVKTIHKHDGQLVDFAAVKESLEDYFMRVQDVQS